MATHNNAYMNGNDKVTIISTVKNADGEMGIVINILFVGGYASAFMNKEEMLRLYHQLGDALMAIEPPTTDNHIT